MSSSARRLMKEAAELSSSPSPHFHAHPISDNLYDWHFTLSGPPSSPYANGIYHGRIILPPTYPLRPPSFRFLTPSGRFEVNREICLSISGHHEETWQPAWGIRTALIAIRSFMEGDAKGQLGGLDVDDRVRKEWAEKSRGWRCEVCSGRLKTNEEILHEWREYCREKGVVVDGQGGEVLVSSGGDGKESSSRSDGDNDKDGSNSGLSLDENSPAGVDACAIYSNAVSSSISTSTSTLLSRDPRPDSTTISDSNPTSNLVPDQNQNQNQNQPSNISSAHQFPQQQQHQQPFPIPQQQQSTSEPWLDRAIMGVTATLVFMILRRILNSYYDDYV
ncbi:hypothetical protein MAP00_000803 [Monascus purpureus]|nr:hypothetical protein MAP00_000803 [Monascus purpureus]